MTAGEELPADFGVLGPLSAEVAGSPVPLQSAKTRVVLASLLLRPNRTVSIEELVDRLWDNDPPSGARNATQSYVMRLRKALGSAGSLISTQPAGYLIEAPADAVDLGRFRARIAAADKARTQAQPEDEARELREALALWRGAPLSDVPSELLHVQEVQRLAEERLSALERLMDVELSLDRHAEIIGELYALTEENRLRERFWGQLMLALYRADRQADALTVYRKVSTILREELGIDPGEGLRELHQQILGSGDGKRAPRVAAPQPRRAKPPTAATWTAPFQLPAGVPDFVGREYLVARIRELTIGRTEDDHAVPIVVLSGPPGAGKTALAVHAAHQLRRDFPDGALWVNLRGYSTSPPLAATDALARFLRALGVAVEHIPHEVDEQSALLRTLLAGRKVIMVLDNAASPEHVRPLLPAESGCAVLITSRNNLPGLTALNGARRLPVEIISPSEATTLISKIIGADRVAAETEAAKELAATCGFLPLSLRIAATNLAMTGGLSVADYVKELRSGSRLDAMKIEGDDQAAVRLAFDLSYSTLKPTLSHFFRMLSLIPGADFDWRGAAAVAGTDPAQTQRMLGALVSANLISEIGSGRYAFHDLINEFATERAQEQETAEERHQARERLFGFYLRWANSASLFVYVDAHAVALPDIALSEPEPEWANADAAMAWLETEAENLVAMTCVTPTDCLPVWALADAIATYLYRGRYDSIWKSAFTAALAAADGFGSAEAQASAHRGLGRLHYQHTDYEAAEQHLTRAVELYRQANDPVNQARALNTLAAIAVNRARFQDAVEYTNDCLRLVEVESDPAGRHRYLFNKGMQRIHFGQVVEGTAAISEAMLEPSYKVIRAMGLGAFGLRDLWAGDLGSALRHFEQMLTESSDARHAIGLVEAESNIANTALIAGFPELATALAEHALHTAQQAEWAWAMIGALVLLGNAALALDDLAAAEDHFTQARKAAGTAGNYWDASIIRGTSAILRLSDRPAEAAELAATGLKAELPRERSEVHTELAAALLATGDHQGAIEHARQAWSIAEQYGYRLYQIDALHMLADACEAAGDEAAAADTRTRATALTEPMPAEIGPTLRRLVAELESSEED
ncbi:MAG TPA: BTAD domain-containing putative transcriptional regulator [Pseudonocardiaceae bacterium]|nr:BTAD domain-containing putative transcriptional regulator [Pseudonocardiaceae bacterium]